jgi:hypothetical protein
MSDGMPPLPPPFREQLLPTEADAVDRSAVDEIRGFCEGSPQIEVAYVCSVERTCEGEEPEKALRLSVKLVTPGDGSDDGREQQLSLFKRFAQTHPEVARTLGFGVLTDHAIPAFERYGLVIYRR